MKNIRVIVSLLALLTTTQFSLAQQTDTTTEAEKRYLIKMAKEIKALNELVAKAAANADPDARVVFDYTSLRNDLAEIQRAVETHINAPSRSPRKINALELK